MKHYWNSDKCTMLVSSCDEYADTWDAFFTIFKKQWPLAEYPRIVLNTESLSYNFEDLEVQTYSLYPQGKKIPWGKRLIAHLDHISTPLVFFTLDDFYPLKQMDVDSLEKVIDLMINNPSIPVFYLNIYGESHQSDKYPEYNVIDHDSHIRMKVQAAIWRKDLWYKYLRKHETAWQLETYGTLRAKRFREDFFCYGEESQVAYVRDPYKYGLIKAKWQIKTPELFSNYGIDCDFDIRGFVTDEDNESGKVYSLKQNIYQFYKPAFIKELMYRIVCFIRSMI